MPSLGSPTGSSASWCAFFGGRWYGARPPATQLHTCMYGCMLFQRRIPASSEQPPPRRPPMPTLDLTLPAGIPDARQRLVEDLIAKLQACDSAPTTRRHGRLPGVSCTNCSRAPSPVGVDPQRCLHHRVFLTVPEDIPDVDGSYTRESRNLSVREATKHGSLHGARLTARAIVIAFGASESDRRIPRRLRSRATR